MIALGGKRHKKSLPRFIIGAPVVLNEAICHREKVGTRHGVHIPATRAELPVQIIRKSADDAAVPRENHVL